MKKILVVCCSALLMVMGCKDRTPVNHDGVLPDEELVDTTDSDEANGEEEMLEELMAVEEPMPVAAEELFDDFFFNFASSMRVQLERTVFPLLIDKGGHTDTIERQEWKFNPFFMEQGYYTLIFDNQKQFELVKDTAVDETVVETFLADVDAVVQHRFRRSGGKWQLYAACQQALDANPNASFVRFYRQFAIDSAFQQQSLGDVIEFSGRMSDDDEEEMEGFITPDSWEGFAPQLPEPPLFNIVYGRQDSLAHQKIFIIRGISNSEELEMTFRHEADGWKLVKLFE